MGNGEVQVITKIMESHQEENRTQLSELRDSTTKVADAVSTLTTTIARVEERHARHDDGLKRVGKQVDDHETRIRTLESNKSAVKGGWKVIVAVLAGSTTVIGLAFAALSYFQSLGG